MHDTFISAHPSERGPDHCRSAPPPLCNSMRVITAVLPLPQPHRTAAWDVNIHRNASLECSCLEELEFIARDIEHFERNNCDHYVEEYIFT